MMLSIYGGPCTTKPTRVNPFQAECNASWLGNVFRVEPDELLLAIMDPRETETVDVVMPRKQGKR